MKTKSALFFLALIFLSAEMNIAICQVFLKKNQSNPKASIEDRVNDLLKRMTLEEKVQQLGMTSLINFSKTPNVYGVCESPFVSLDTIAKQSAAAKKHAFENTRLGIPPIQIAECLHGVLAYGATIFPQAIAQGSTWNPALIKRMAGTIATEASAAGVDQALSPLFDLIRDPRYGRNEECYGEDPYLVGKIGSAFVIGMQGDVDLTINGIPKGKIMCTAKHFAAYSAPVAGINLAPTAVGERELRTFYLLPFEMAVKEANIYSIMPSYNEMDGTPAHANSFLLNKVLRKEWGFNGYVFSDYGGVSMLNYFHHIARDKQEAALQAIHAGVDLEAPNPEAYQTLVQLVKDGKLPEEIIDQTVRRILTVKFKAGLFEKKYADGTQLAKVKHTAEAVNLAKEIAEESIILLKNENNLLPLDQTKLKSIAVVGPNANQVQYGDYSYTRDNSSGVTVLEGIKNLVGKNTQVNYAKGCGISSLNKDGFEEAIAAVEKSDVAVVVLGETSAILSGLGWGNGPGKEESHEPFTNGEGYDVSDINPTGVQRELIQAIARTGKPIVLILIHGRPWSIKWEKENIPAIVEAWYPGEQGGNAIANILFGKVNPSGRLNATFPQTVGHIPVVYNYKPSSKGYYHQPGTPEKPGRDYVFSSPAALFPFGYGLSYTSFQYSDMSVSKKKFGKEDIQVFVNVKNTGGRTGKEVVQLYIRDKVSSVTTPVMALKRFEKIELHPGESKRVTFNLSYKELGLWNSEMQFVTEPGEFEFMFAKSAEDIQCKETVEFEPNQQP
ncbi:glycoside hydrolase family 3 C-terminal domain-containing protein [Chitinophagaceae bacterium LB-8]|uniref:Glycoside hydrolase family 3 C-terminal domain-containing protein n=1 Tax=Paraflavisolibacter caeni TaxID=2982496 RepID=A0A9X2Y0B9_9BACT|nr:glycoside hydrolase family 3 N-terminal domain-containing protein [Paraflavisolibacter caeni]MCU7552226.1 glycoside hydrolase family 3 C-terminal domain-containing protein [Paraflavisolibacter caeni]